MGAEMIFSCAATQHVIMFFFFLFCLSLLPRLLYGPVLVLLIDKKCSLKRPVTGFKKKFDD